MVVTNHRGRPLHLLIQGLVASRGGRARRTPGDFGHTDAHRSGRQSHVKFAIDRGFDCQDVWCELDMRVITARRARGARPGHCCVVVDLSMALSCGILNCHEMYFGL